MDYKNCLYCNKEFIAKPKNKIFCCNNCASKHWAVINSDLLLKKRIKDREKKRAYDKKRRIELNDEMRKKDKITYYKHYKKRLLSMKKWRENNKDKKAKSDKKYRIKNIEKVRIYQKNYIKIRKNVDMLFKLNINLKSSLRTKLIRSKSSWKKRKFSFTLKELKNHLEKPFNNFDWKKDFQYYHISHLIPISWFFDDEENFWKIGWNLNNLALLPIKENLNQSNNYALIDNIRFYDKQSAIMYFKEKYIPL